MPALVVGFREGLEGFLVVAVALRFLERSGRSSERSRVWVGAAAGVVLSVLFGAALFGFGDLLGGAGRAAKLWEIGASLAALALVTTFVIWMINHGSELTRALETDLGRKTKAAGMALVVLAMVLREGVEVALFAFAGTYPVAGVALGLLLALVLVWLVFVALVKVNLGLIFNVTLAYLVLQAGFLLGYGIHEGLSAAKDAGLLAPSHPIYAKAFDLSKSVLDHKTGALGIPLYALFGWYSRPEWIQFAAQYLYTAAVFAWWVLSGRSKGKVRV